MAPLPTDDDFELCNAFCNKGKHLRHNRGDPTLKIEHWGAVYGHVVYGVAQYGVGGRKFKVVDNDKEIEGIELGGPQSEVGEVPR